MKTSCGCLAVLIAWLVVPSSLVFASSAIEPDDFRIYCGYLDALNMPQIRALNPKHQQQKIAQLAQIQVQELASRVDRIKTLGPSCEGVGNHYQKLAEQALREEFKNDLERTSFDIGDPSHVLASVVLYGKDVDDAVQKAARAAYVINQHAPIVKTMALRVINHGVEGQDENNIWFEGKISQDRVLKIEKSRISSFANTRYLRLFDGVIIAAAPVLIKN